MVLSREQLRELQREKQNLEIYQPGLRSVPWEIKSKATPDYNCIAFVLGIENQRWQPEPQSGDYWPDDIPTTDTIDSWLKLFEKYRFVRCSDGNFEPGFLKIAIYVKEDIPQHVAKLSSNGVWHSKMGCLVDIHHPLSALNYGEAKFFLKRQSEVKQPSRKARKRARRS